jgi:acyl-CoA thioesterase-1
MAASKATSLLAARLVAAALLLAASMGLAQAAAAAPVILLFGDSLSAEYGLPRGAGWGALLEARLKEKRLDYSVVNVSISGETTSGGAARIDAALQQHRPAIVIIELGGNDGLRGLALDATRANLTRMLAASGKAGAKVVLAGMQLPPNYGRTYVEGFRTLYADLARQHKAALVPFFLENVADKRELFQADGIHPTREAQPLLLDNTWKALAPLLGSAPSKK